jgi:hypothetical protein
LLTGGAVGGVVVATRAHRTVAPTIARPVANPPSPARLDPQARTAMLGRIQSARRAAPAAANPPSQLDPGYVSDAIRAILPLFKECFEHAVERTPELSGKVVIGFTIVADPTVGGLVSDSQVVDDKSTIADPELRECIQENIYAAQFPPPPAGGEMHVEYPFVLKAADESPE